MWCKHAFYWRYDTGEELELLNRLAVGLCATVQLAPRPKAVGYTSTVSGRHKRIYEQAGHPMAPAGVGVPC